MGKKQAKRKRNSRSFKLSDNKMKRHLLEGGMILLAALAIFLLLSLATYHNTDPGWSNTGDLTSIKNAGGRTGAWLADVLLYIFGYVAYLFPIILAFSGWLMFQKNYGDECIPKWVYYLRASGFVLIFISLTGIFSSHLSSSPDYLPYSAGGILGSWIGPGLAGVLNNVGSSLLLVALLLVGITLGTGLSWLWVMDSLGNLALLVYEFCVSEIQSAWEKHQERREEKAALYDTEEKEDFYLGEDEDAEDDEEDDEEEGTETKGRRSAPIINMPVYQVPKNRDKMPAGPQFEGSELSSLPPLYLLERAKVNKDGSFSKEILEKLSRLLEEKLKEFNVTAHVVAVYPGPVITRFELDLAAGTKASRVTNISRDLARSLSVVSVRVVEVIPGKSYVGLEIPNENREEVRLSEIIESAEYEKAESPISLALGKDISGQAVVVDLAKMPHLLVAGTTGSGKSVGINAMLISLLYKGTPDEVRLILVDPKMLELSIYEGIPHLLTPVIIDMKEAANALRWCIGEMDRRYRLMAALGVRNLAGYNVKVKEARSMDKPLTDPLWPEEAGTPAPELEVLPNIVIVIDEFADMMMVVGKKVEELIARLAQKARAAGIHLIIATQRPSVDVITGLIKANIPTRIAFQVSSRIDSRTILDQQGAEQLLGYGDMLYMATGKDPIRVHGAFVADDEVHNVVKDLKKRGKPSYLEEVLQGDSSINESGLPAGNDGGDDLDPLFDEAVQIVATTRRASISNIQRRLKIGYNRAARIVEEMEAQGMVSAMESNGNREVLLPEHAE